MIEEQFRRVMVVVHLQKQHVAEQEAAISRPRYHVNVQSDSNSLNSNHSISIGSQTQSGSNTLSVILDEAPPDHHPGISCCLSLARKSCTHSHHRLSNSASIVTSSTTMTSQPNHHLLATRRQGRSLPNEGLTASNTVRVVPMPIGGLNGIALCRSLAQVSFSNLRVLT